jgi:hypothetical protein
MCCSCDSERSCSAVICARKCLRAAARRRCEMNSRIPYPKANPINIPVISSITTKTPRYATQRRELCVTVTECLSHTLVARFVPCSVKPPNKGLFPERFGHVCAIPPKLRPTPRPQFGKIGGGNVNDYRGSDYVWLLDRRKHGLLVGRICLFVGARIANELRILLAHEIMRIAVELEEKRREPIEPARRLFPELRCSRRRRA